MDRAPVNLHRLPDLTRLDSAKGVTLHPQLFFPIFARVQMDRQREHDVTLLPSANVRQEH
jgi:hypothetical protein